MKTNKKLMIYVLMIVLAGFGFAGCGPKHTHPADIAATYIVPADQAYQIAERSLLTMHDLCAALGDNCPKVLKPIYDNWNHIDDINDKAAEQIRKVHTAWQTLSNVKTPENEADLKKQIEILSQMIADLSAFIPDKGAK